MTTYVLVHGAWSGAHGFRLVRRRLAAAGHEVFTPSLTGLGERSHLVSPEIGLGTHVHDLVNHVWYEDLHDIVLVGFSYGGMVISGALAHIADRVRHLVYLDAIVPGDGDSVSSLLGWPVTESFGPQASWLVTSVPRTFDDPDEGAFMVPRRDPHPARCFVEPVRLARPLESYPFSRLYIRATADAPDAPGRDAFERFARHAQESPAWTYRGIATNHMIASNRPDELTAVLLELA